MLTIGQLAAHAGVSTKAVRVYHAKGLLPEPERDSAGYRRYDAQAVINLTRIVTLARAGVPLANIPDVLDAPDPATLIEAIDAKLREQVRTIDERRARLRELDRPDRLCLPPDALEFMDRLRLIGLTARHEQAFRDGWILGYALAPELTRAVVRSRAALLDDADYVAVLRAYDDAIDWSPDDPRLHNIADAAAVIALRMMAISGPPEVEGLQIETVDILDGHLGIDTPAWQKLDQLLTQRLSDYRAQHP